MAETTPAVELNHPPSTIHHSLTAISDLALRTPDFAPPSTIDASPVLPPALRRKTRRNGRIASLPKLQRDMVSRMIWNGVPYKNIVQALVELGCNATERNISNWATGGYLEWRFEQDLSLQNRLDQDHILDHLRREDASELPEVGLQAAATRLSQILLDKTARAENIEANLGAFSQMVDILTRLNREITALQKQRDDARRTLGGAHDPNRIKHTDESSVNEIERFYSDPPADSTLAKPVVPPALPPVPTSSILEECDREAEREQETKRLTRWMDAFQAFGLKKPSSPSDPKSLPPAKAEPDGAAADDRSR
jgi:hypothetical protein